jgi:hypothetical protein
LEGGIVEDGALETLSDRPDFMRLIPPLASAKANGAVVERDMLEN